MLLVRGSARKFIDWFWNRSGVDDATEEQPVRDSRRKGDGDASGAGLQVGDGTVEGRKGRHAASRESLLADGEGEAGLEGDGVLQEKLGVGVLNSPGPLAGRGLIRKGVVAVVMQNWGAQTGRPTACPTPQSGLANSRFLCWPASNISTGPLGCPRSRFLDLTP